MTDLEQTIKEFVRHLEEGHVILYPTDTIWGLGCDPFNEAAVDKVFRFKERPREKNLILLADSIDMITRYIRQIPDDLLKIALNATSPLTVIYPGSENFPEYLLHESGTIAIRIVGHELDREVIRLFGKPIVSTSANISGMPAASEFSQIDQRIKEQVDYIVPEKFDTSIHRRPSALVRLEQDNSLTWIRK